MRKVFIPLIALVVLLTQFTFTSAQETKPPPPPKQIQSNPSPDSSGSRTFSPLPRSINLIDGETNAISPGDVAPAPVIEPETRPGDIGDLELPKFIHLKSTQTIFHHPDHLGGTSVDTDEDGNVIQVIDYYPFGSTRLQDNTGDYRSNYKFTGKELDKSTNLYYYGARYYDPVIGRFISMDPQLLDLNTMDPVEFSKFLEDPQNLNMFSYVLNNPLKYVDPTGEAPQFFEINMEAFGMFSDALDSLGVTFMIGSYSKSLGKILPKSIQRLAEGYAVSSATTGLIDAKHGVEQILKQESVTVPGQSRPGEETAQNAPVGLTKTNPFLKAVVKKTLGRNSGQESGKRMGRFIDNQIDSVTVNKLEDYKPITETTITAPKPTMYQKVFNFFVDKAERLDRMLSREKDNKSD